MSKVYKCDKCGEVSDYFESSTPFYFHLDEKDYCMKINIWEQQDETDDSNTEDLCNKCFTSIIQEVATSLKEKYNG